MEHNEESSDSTSTELLNKEIAGNYLCKSFWKWGTTLHNNTGQT